MMALTAFSEGGISTADAHLFQFMQKKYGMFGTDLADFEKKMIDRWRAAGRSDESIKQALEMW